MRLTILLVVVLLLAGCGDLPTAPSEGRDKVQPVPRATPVAKVVK